MAINLIAKCLLYSWQWQFLEDIRSLRQMNGLTSLSLSLSRESLTFVDLRPRAQQEVIKNHFACALSNSIALARARAYETSAAIITLCGWCVRVGVGVLVRVSVCVERFIWTGLSGRARTVRMCQVVRTHVLHGDSYTCQIMTPNCMCQKCFRFRSDRYVTNR